MVNVYVNLIKKGLREIDQVPEIWREDVRKQLNENEKGMKE